MSDTIENKPTTKSPREAAFEPKSNAAIEASRSASATEIDPQPVKRSSKSSLVLQMLQRPEGTMIAQIVTATGWQSHTTRAALTGLKKKCHAISSEKAMSKERVYKVASR